MKAKRVGSTLVASRKNPSPGDDWGEQGPESFEREMMVRDVVESTPNLMKFDPEVFAAISPRGREYLKTHQQGQYADGFVDDEYSVFVVLRKRDEKNAFRGVTNNDELHTENQNRAGIAHAAEDIVRRLNEQWPVDNATWVRPPWGWGNYGNVVLFELEVPESRGAYYRGKGLQHPQPFSKKDDREAREKMARRAAAEKRKDWSENPFLGPESAEQRFLEILHDPDPLAIEIAVDMLEEGNLDLAEVSQRNADPMWISRGFDEPPKYIGVFDIGTAVYEHFDGWWYSPANRSLRLDDPNFILVEWWVMRAGSEGEDRHPHWYHEVYFWRKKQGWGDLKDSPAYPDAEAARDGAIEAAWRIVQLLKSSPSLSNNRIAQRVFQKGGQFAEARDVMQLHTSENPASGKKSNPPEEGQRAVVAEFERMLREPDAESLIVAKDLLEQNNIPLSLASRWQDEDWTVNFTESGGDAGVFELGDERGLHPRYADKDAGSYAELADIKERADIYKAVTWLVLPEAIRTTIAGSQRRVDRYSIEVLLWWNGRAAALESVFYSPVSGGRQSGVRQHGGGSRRFQTLERAREYAVQVAWAAVTWLKQNWENAQNTSVTALVALLRKHNPVPLDPSVNPAKNPHQGRRELPKWGFGSTNWQTSDGYNAAKRQNIRFQDMPLGRGTIEVAIDALLQEDYQHGFELAEVTGYYEDALAIWQKGHSPEHLKWTPPGDPNNKWDKAAQASKKQFERDQELFKQGYAIYTLEALERVIGLRENPAPPNTDERGVAIIDSDSTGETGWTMWYPDGDDDVGSTADFLIGERAYFGHDIDEYAEHDDSTRIYRLHGYSNEELLRIKRRVVPGWQEMEDRAFEENPCVPKHNPAWVTRHLADSWVTLEQQVPAKWLPKLDHTVAKGKRLSAEIPEYGCGAYGCVFPTLDPKVVMKLTTDDTEAQFAARLAKQLPVPIVTTYELVLHLPTAKRQGRNVYLLWREAADDVGQVDKVAGAAAEDAIDKQHKAAQKAFDKLAQGEPAERELAAWTSAVKGMGKVPALKWLADGMLTTYEKTGIFFGDIHGGNLGRARGQWVITDPGHVAVVKR